jgi:biopolymer transport protein ExbD
MAGKATSLSDKELELDFTSMIDCVFLLLIFFMCATKFKQVEQRLDCFLPTDEGQLSKPFKLEKPEEVVIFVQDDHTARNSQVFDIKFNRSATYYLQSKDGSPITNPNDLLARLKPLGANPEQEVLIRMRNKNQGDKDQETPFGNIIKVVDVCKLAGISKIKFEHPYE